MRDPVKGIDVFKSDEFKALCGRFGVVVPEYATEMKLFIPANGLFRVAIESILEHPEQTDDCVELIPQKGSE